MNPRLRFVIRRSASTRATARPDSRNFPELFMPVAEVSPLSPTPAPAPAPTAPPLPSGDLAVQVVIYAPDGTIVVEGTGTTQQDGSIEIEISLPQPPPAGTPVQILIYDADGNPTLNEGTIGPVAPDGSYPINVG